MDSLLCRSHLRIMFVHDNLVSPVLQILHIHHQEAGGRIYNLELSDGRDSTLLIECG
jgi:hypothetical protein